jgi:hypothetical protein
MIIYNRKKEYIKQALSDKDYVRALWLSTNWGIDDYINEILKYTDCNMLYNALISFDVNYNLIEKLLEAGAAITFDISVAESILYTRLNGNKIIKLLKLYHKLQT